MTAIIDPDGYDLNRLRWQCRRGMLELDYLLSDLLERQFPVLSAAEKAEFVRLLEESDQDLQRWLVSGEPSPDPRLRSLIERLRNASLPDTPDV